MNKEKINQLVQNLSSFDSNERRAALIQLHNQLSFNGEELQNVNMHFHSFNSYNAEFWSPTQIAWEAKKNALYAAGIIDFDVLAGLEEYFEAGELLGIRTSVGIETRAFLHEYAHKEIDSSGEPGVSYIAGTGFYELPEKDSEQALTLASYNQKAAERNIDLIHRINKHVPEIALDYNEVLALTPSGNATERHIISAYVQKATQVYQEPGTLVSYWSGLLGLGLEKTAELIESGNKLEDVVRSKFAKRGGFGYVQPSSDTFPPVEDFFAFVKSCGAIPMESWLDGTSDGEKDGKALLELSKSKGAAALNLIPDRNWNIADSKVKAIKTQNLKNIIETAVSMDMPIHIGTEMNKKGLPFVDDLNGADLNPYKEIFLNGAQIIVGHTLLGRFADFTYLGEKAESEFCILKNRNAFFASIGALSAVDSKIANTLREAGEEKAYSIMCDSAKQGKWKL
jgi:hypothetical protein